MVQLTNPFHAGVVVPDVEEAMAQYSANSGLRWHSVQDRELHLLVDGEVVASRLSFT